MDRRPSPKRAGLRPSVENQQTPGEPHRDEEWVIWYVDTFDRDCPPSREAGGSGLVEGLAQLWARHLFEIVRPDNQNGFSSFHLKWRLGRIEIDGEREGGRRLREWMFGEKEHSYRGYAAEADPALLGKVAAAHAHLIERGRKAEEILAAAQTAKDSADFATRLDDLIKRKPVKRFKEGGRAARRRRG